MGGCGSKTTNQDVSITKHAGKQIKKQYHISHEVIGKGAFAQVFKGNSISNPDLIVAIKSINKANMGQDDLDAIGDEIKALQALDHPNIVKYFDVYEDNKYMFIVTEFCEGSTLMDLLTIKKHFSETETKHIIMQITSAINHCHMIKVSHRDIKPTNIMIDDDMNVTLIDYGLSKLTSTNRFKSIIGSPMYMAPEVFKGSYSNKCDIWSLGVLTYHLITGNPPFDGGSIDEVKKKANSGKIKFSSPVWRRTSSK
jgi:calcium-dependent protein kinase